VLANIDVAKDAKKITNLCSWMVNKLLESLYFIYGDFNIVDAYENKEGMLHVILP